MRRDNSFDTLRLLAASAVIVGHSWPLLDLPFLEVSGLGLHGIGVMIFFAISGYLITRSWRDDPHLQRFIAKRALRIMPALLAVVLITALVVGPLITTLPLTQYLASPAT